MTNHTHLSVASASYSMNTIPGGAHTALDCKVGVHHGLVHQTHQDSLRVVLLEQVLTRCRLALKSSKSNICTPGFPPYRSLRPLGGGGKPELPPPVRALTVHEANTGAAHQLRRTQREKGGHNLAFHRQPHLLMHRNNNVLRVAKEPDLQGKARLRNWPRLGASFVIVA